MRRLSLNLRIRASVGSGVGWLFCRALGRLGNKPLQSFKLEVCGEMRIAHGHSDALVSRCLLHARKLLRLRGDTSHHRWHGTVRESRSRCEPLRGQARQVSAAWHRRARPRVIRLRFVSFAQQFSRAARTYREELVRRACRAGSARRKNPGIASDHNLKKPESETSYPLISRDAFSSEPRAPEKRQTLTVCASPETKPCRFVVRVRYHP